MKAVILTSPEPVTRIVKTATCLSLSGKSQLGYQVSVDSEGEIYIRVSSNSGGGYWNPDLVPISSIQQILAKVPSDKPMTSFLLHSLFTGKSQNNSGFIWSVLKNLGLVQLREDKQRCYALTDGKAFFAEIKALSTSGADINVEVAKNGAGKGQKTTGDRSIPKKEKPPVPPTQVKTPMPQSPAALKAKAGLKKVDAPQRVARTQLDS